MSVSPSTIPPAASVGPSVPSVATEAMTTLSSPSMPRAAERASSWFLPPNPFPFTWTTVSPPRITAQGLFTGRSLETISRTIPPKKTPASRASQSKVAVSIIELYPSFSAAVLAVSQAMKTLPIIFVSTFSNDFGVSLFVALETLEVSFMPYFCIILRASWEVVESG